MRKSATSTNGHLLASALAGSWRSEPPGAELSEAELAAISHALIGSGAGALAWWKIRRTGLRATEAAQDLQHSYRLQTLKAAVREGELGRLFMLLHSAGVDAVLIKGWAASNVYPEPGLRPEGDIDLCVRPEQYVRAKEVLAGEEGRAFWVDLHEGFGRLTDCGTGELFERSRLLKVGGSDVRVLCEEDHLRLLCLHLLRHGAWRPLWLCDVAAAVEARGESFDWGLLLGGDARRAQWVACALALAHVLLGARIEGTPVADAVGRLPRWLTRSVLEQWENPYTEAHESPPLMRTYLRRPAELFGAARRRWPDPIRASVYFGASFNEFPRFPYQLGRFIGSSTQFLARLPSEMRAG